MLSTRLVMTSRSIVGISLGAARRLRKRPVPPSKIVPPVTAPSFRNSRRCMISLFQLRLDVEPWRNPDIFNVEREAQELLEGQRNNGQEKDHQDGVLQQALALIIFGVVTAVQRVHQKAADGEETADYRGAEDGFAEVGGDAENVRQIAIDLVDEAIVIPGLPGPEPLPAGAADKGADGNHRDPENDEAEEECADLELALLPGVVAGAERIGIYIRYDHQSDDDERRHDHAGNPRVEVDQHFLEAEEIPRGLRGVHREVRIRGLFA